MRDLSEHPRALLRLLLQRKKGTITDQEWNEIAALEDNISNRSSTDIAEGTKRAGSVCELAGISPPMMEAPSLWFKVC
jgi:hypothetical protein